MSDSPAVILFDVNGNPIGTVIDGVYYRLQVEAKLAAGEEVIGKVGIDGYETGGLALDSTLSEKLNESTFIARTNTLGQKTMAGGMPVTLASDQTPLAVSGTVVANAGTGTFAVSAASLPLPTDAATQTTLALIKAKTDNIDVALSTRAVTGLTDTQLRSSPVSISGTVTTSGLTDAQLRAEDVGISATSLPLPTDASTEATLSTRLADSTFTGRINTFGQKSMAASTPVVIASNQSPISVTVVSGEASTSNLKTAYDIGETVIYIGTAELGSATSAAVWTIKRTTLVDGVPTFAEWSDSTAVWNDRLIEVYT